MNIGFATQHPHSHYWLLVEQGARERATELDVNLTVLPAKTLDQQIAAIDHLVSQHIDGLLLGAVAATGLDRTISRLYHMRIPVIAVATELLDCSVTCTVQSAHRTGATLAARYVVEQLGGSGAVAHIVGPTRLRDNRERATGVRAVFQQHEHIELVAEHESPDWHRSSGTALMRTILNTAPHVRGVCVANDTLALGVIDAIDAADRTGEIIVTGFDAMPEAVLAIHQGRLSATVQQSMRMIGRTAVDIAWRVARGETVEPQALIDVALITRANLIEAALEPLAALPHVLSEAISRGEALAQARDDIIRAQQAVLHELSTPLIPISDTVMVLPLIGTLDAIRAQQITATLLQGIATHTPQVVILDITGVTVVDTQVIQAVLQAVQAAHLLGTQVMLTGINPAMAQTLVSLGVDLQGLLVRSTLQSGIAYALQRRSF